MNRLNKIIILVFLMAVAIYCLSVMGDVGKDVFWLFRFPLIATCVLAGASMSMSGLIMQSYFQNPLAGPFVLGVHGGSTLMVALWIFGLNEMADIYPALFSNFSLVTVSIIGSFFILFLLLIADRRSNSRLTILLFGLIFGHFTSGVINILMGNTDSEKIKVFLLWTLGSFSRVTTEDLYLFAPPLILSIVTCFLFIRSMNLLSLGDDFAKTGGVDTKRVKNILILLCGTMVGVVSSYCGPIIFLGVISPHIARFYLKTSGHLYIVPATFLIGANLALGAQILSQSSEIFLIPINGVLGVIGGPLLCYFVWKMRRNIL
jgi:iron complex transport system permease protein